jgi:hypothetical protein
MTRGERMDELMLSYIIGNGVPTFSLPVLVADARRGLFNALHNMFGLVGDITL